MATSAMTATPTRYALPRLGERGAVTLSVKGRRRALALHSGELVPMACGGTAGWRRRAPAGRDQVVVAAQHRSSCISLTGVRHVGEVRGIATKKCMHCAVGPG